MPTQKAGRHSSSVGRSSNNEEGSKREMINDKNQSMKIISPTFIKAVSILALLLILLLSSCSNVTEDVKQEERKIFWKTSTPEEQGMDSSTLLEMFEYVEKQPSGIHSLLIVRNGYIVLEAYYHPHTWDQKHIINSCTKTFVSALTGIAISKGFIKDVDSNVLDYFPEYNISNNDELKKGIKIKHLLTMTSGIDWPQYGPNNISDRMGKSDDWIKFILDRPMASKPGDQTNYSNGDSHLLSAIIQKTTGKTALDFGWDHFFTPLGISDVTWYRDPQGVNIGSATIYIIPRDMAKFGYLYLNKGKWGGKSIVPADWIDTSFQSHTKMPTKGGPVDYGYYWWLYPERGLYEAWGGQGQRIGVFPELNIVTVMTSDIPTDSPRSPFFSNIYEYIVESVKSSNALPPDAAASSELVGWGEKVQKP